MRGIPATFSVVYGRQTGTYDAQIESEDQDYIYVTEVDLAGLLEFIEKYENPIDSWPLNGPAAPGRHSGRYRHHQYRVRGGAGPQICSVDTAGVGTCATRLN